MSGVCPKTHMACDKASCFAYAAMVGFYRGYVVCEPCGWRKEVEDVAPQGDGSEDFTPPPADEPVIDDDFPSELDGSRSREAIAERVGSDVFRPKRANASPMLHALIKLADNSSVAISPAHPSRMALEALGLINQDGFITAAGKEAAIDALFPEQVLVLDPGSPPPSLKPGAINYVKGQLITITNPGVTPDWLQKRFETYTRGEFPRSGTGNVKCDGITPEKIQNAMDVLERESVPSHPAPLPHDGEFSDEVLEAAAEHALNVRPALRIHSIDEVSAERRESANADAPLGGGVSSAACSDKEQAVQ